MKTRPPCEVEGCPKESLVRGMCQQHYDRKRRYGDTYTRPLTANCIDCGVEFKLPTYGTPTVRCKECKVTNHRKKLREQRWEKGLREGYKITPDDYFSMLEEQEGKCAICGTDKPVGRGAKNKRFSVDHNHSTGTVRGLLCSRCNTGIGLLGDNVNVLESAINYLVRTNGKV